MVHPRVGWWGPLARLAPLTLWLALGAGCTYVTQSAYEKKIDSLDQDGDGAPYGGPDKDCDDLNPDRTPGAPEIPYDGIDNDCDGSDLVDVDGDLFPGIAKADWAPQHDGLEWPEAVAEGPVDCDDEEPNTYPTKPTDPPYDGVDADCDCANDFDVDGDGDVPPEHEAAFADFAASSCYSGPTPRFTDCNDFEPGAHGGVQDDPCGDGVDADCSGDNDYDCDDDGYMPDTVDPNDFQLFVNQYHDGAIPASWGPAEYGDCDDADPAIYPGAPDAVGDGIDSDCGCNTAWDNDFDGDGDGWIPPGEAAALATYASTWCAGQTQPPGEGEGDCDDTDPMVNPGQLEILGDAVDSDCDGDPDTTPLDFSDLAWTAPRPPALGRTDRHYVLGATADSFTDPPNPPFSEAAVALLFDLDAGPGAAPANPPILVQGAGTVYPLGPSVDLDTLPDEFRIAYTYDRDLQTYALTRRYVFNTLTNTYDPDATDVSAVAPYANVDIDIELDPNEDAWVWSVGTDRLHVLHGDSTNGPDAGASLAIPSGAAVFLDDPGLGISTGTVCDPAGCQSFTYDGNTIEVAPTQPWAGDAAVSAHQIEGVVALADGVDGVVVDDGSQSNLLLSGVAVVQAQAALAPSSGLLYVLALADDGAVILSWGDPVVGSFQSATVPVDAALSPTGIGLHVDDDRVFIGVSAVDGAGSDAVGWLFLGPA